MDAPTWTAIDLAIKFFQMFDQALNQQPERSRQLAGGILNQLRYPPANVRNPLRDDKSEFAKETAYLVCLCSTRFYRIAGRLPQLD
ncbi:hypothetical protein NA66_104327 [Burkholderia pyrrocinia]|uniref:Uncharacterized protein n=1 Tax=Burkholderia pyrrocinia TaxID=60550 RepID=A0A318HU53_BURPY|nr:hypothetical protein NA66_104327 [Burkholderia pyrrocinia]SFW90002.1 hypothetical protein SAMN03159384_06918 [Burkholderia sp. NFACC33-1]SFY46379.1 hypothetical protein SAMN03159408_06914 [Burkholderia sp. NFPP32]